MIIVAIDTSHQVGRVSVARSGEVLAGGRFGERESHLREIGSAVDRALSDAGLAVADIERLALVSGPGSFTGLRIGMAFVKGLHAASNIPVVTIDSLELLALAFTGRYSLVLPLIDARKDEVYAALYAPSRLDDPARPADSILPPAVAAPAAFLQALMLHERVARCEDRILCTGSGSARYERAITDVLGSRAVFASGDALVPSTDLLSKRGHYLTPLSEETLMTLEPVYIRSSDAVFKRLSEVKRDG
jgi:tRNA threonylcarbamoyladenosine biosynthesis protein TsaB